MSESVPDALYERLRWHTDDPLGSTLLALGAAGEWVQLISLCRRGNRWTAFRLLRPYLPDADYWRCLRYIWEDTETLWQQRDLRRLIGARRGARDAFMTDEERGLLAALPSIVTVYRGCGERNRDGWAWTLDAASAEWFAKRWGSPDMVLTGTVDRSRIVALLCGRGEHEVIIDPRDVQVSDSAA